MQYFDFQARQGLHILGLDRPYCANAYNQAMLAELDDYLRQYADSDEVAALIIHGGQSRHFCAGADLQEIRQRRAPQALSLRAREVFERLASWPHPTIAAVSGAAVGGGMELALACDLRLGSFTCTFGFPEPELGLIPAAGGCSRASSLLGAALAKEMILFGRRLSAPEALQAGLISEMVSPDALLECAASWAQRAMKHTPLANRLAKQAIDSVQPLASSLRLEGVSQAVLYEMAQAKAPETKAQNTKAPEAEAPEAKTPKAEAPEPRTPKAEAPEAKAPEPKAP